MRDFREIVASIDDVRADRVSELAHYADLFLDSSVPNHISSNLILISTMVYFPENVIFDVTAEVSDNLHPLLGYLERWVSRYFRRSGLDMELCRVALWSLVFGSMAVKVYYSGGGIRYDVVPPYDLGLLYEDRGLESEGQAVVYYYRIPEFIARRRKLVSREVSVSKEVSTGSTFIDRIVTRLDDELRVAYESQFSNVRKVSPRVPRDLVEVYEVWVNVGDGWVRAVETYEGWKTEEYNYCPFVLFVPNRYLIDSVWGLSEYYYAEALQERVSSLDKDIQLFERLMMFPPLIISGLNINLDAEYAKEQLLTPGGVLSLNNPADLVPWKPLMDPVYLARMYEFRTQELREVLSLNEVVLGKAARNVRSGNYASLLANFGTALLRLKALSFESSLEELMTKVVRLKVWNSDKSDVRRLYLLAGEGYDLFVDVYAHSSSPVNYANTTEILLTLGEKGIIPPESLVRILPVPDKEEVLASIKEVKNG